MEQPQIAKLENTKKNSWESQIRPQIKENLTHVCNAVWILKQLCWTNDTNKVLLKVFTGTLSLLFFTPPDAKHWMQNDFLSI